MTELMQSIQTLLEQTGVPVWRRDCVPAEISCPYLTWQLVLAEEGSLTVDAVTRESENDTALADAVEALFPAGGRLMTVQDGWAVVWPQKMTRVEGQKGVHVARLLCRV